MAAKLRYGREPEQWLNQLKHITHKGEKGVGSPGLRTLVDEPEEHHCQVDAIEQDRQILALELLWRIFRSLNDLHVSLAGTANIRRCAFTKHPSV